MKHTSKFILVVGIAMVLSLPARADMDMHHQHEAAHGASYGKPGKAADVDRTIVINAKEIMYDVHEIKVKQGETIRFKLTNAGDQPHEMTIGDKATLDAHRQMMGEMEMDDHHMDGNTINTKPGETKELIWKFTDKGTFGFSCSYPGHTEAGMIGKIVVE
ncbi:MAG: cupredoxin domain-containing protein [Parvibaculaceae bacterium]